MSVFVLTDLPTAAPRAVLRDRLFKSSSVAHEEPLSSDRSPSACINLFDSRRRETDHCEDTISVTGSHAPCILNNKKYPDGVEENVHGHLEYRNDLEVFRPRAKDAKEPFPYIHVSKVLTR